MQNSVKFDISIFMLPVEEMFDINNKNCFSPNDNVQ